MTELFTEIVNISQKICVVQEKYVPLRRSEEWGASRKLLILYLKSNFAVMVTTEKLRELVEEWLQKGDYFLVDVQMSDDDRIVIEIDHADGVWIEDCAELSRFLQDRLGDELGDYELEVGSAGLGQPFKVAQQYVNHVGDQIEVVDGEGKKLTGTLKAVNDRNFIITTIEKQVPEGKKRPVKVEVDKELSMDTVKSAKYLLNFK